MGDRSPEKMKSRLLVLALLIVAGAALYFGLAQPHVSKIPQRVRAQLPDIKPPLPPPPALPPLEIPPMPTLTPPMLPPMERKT